MPQPTNTPNLKTFREDLGLTDEADKPTLTDKEIPKCSDGQVNLDALAAKVREKKKN